MDGKVFEAGVDQRLHKWSSDQADTSANRWWKEGGCLGVGGATPGIGTDRAKNPTIP